jgi:hypothetical protein
LEYALECTPFDVVVIVVIVANWPSISKLALSNSDDIPEFNDMV